VPAPAKNRDPVALVLAGGGARGAYEIGALSVLLPELPAHERPRIVVGTSVGAINAAYLAANAHRPVHELVGGALALWRKITYGRVVKPLASISEAARVWSFAREVLGSRSAHALSLLDPGPLKATLEELIAFEQIHRNVGEGHLSAAAVVATSGVTNLSVVFHDGGRSPRADERRGITYVNTELREQHVRASAAIPVVFPAVAVGARKRWYFDGGTRLNAPIKPALELGGRRVIVIALNWLGHPPELKAERRPDALDGASQLIQAVLVDPLLNDVYMLATINELLADDAEAKVRSHERRTGRRRIPYMLIAPEDPQEIGRLAAEVYRRHYRSPLALLRSPNIAALGRVLNAGRGANRGELLSYLLFAEEFIERLIELGRRDATRWLGSTHEQGRWQLGLLR